MNDITNTCTNPHIFFVQARSPIQKKKKIPRTPSESYKPLPPSIFQNYFPSFATKFWAIKTSSSAAQHLYTFDSSSTTHKTQRTISMPLPHHPPHMKPLGAPSLRFCFIIHRYDRTIQGMFMSMSMFIASSPSPFIASHLTLCC